MKRNPTMKDVAKAAGVSVMTVSRAFKQEASVGEKTRKKIQDTCLLYTSPSPRDKRQSRMPSSA